MKQPGRNIRGLLLLCAALVLLLAAGAVTPGQAETPKPGDLCPYCGIGTWRVFSHGPTEHLLECSYSGCEYTSYGGDKYIVENHYGGQTCGPIAYCEVCGNPYSAEPLHDFGPWEPQGPGGHVRTCRREGCGYQETGSHGGGEATCVKGAVCKDCGFEYTSSRSHNWSDWKPATRETHSRYCRWDGCDARETVGHSGGTATCVKGAVCKDCGFEYTRPMGHDWSDKWADNGKGGHDRFCRRMGCETFWEGKPEPHTGGKATCVKGAVCVVCNAEYTAPDEENHDWGDWTPENMYEHRRQCEECGKQQFDNHSGGTATCVKGAVCKDCGVEYEEAFGHNWTPDTGKGDGGWDWAADGSSATVHLKCSRRNCGETADCTDPGPAKADNGTGWTFTATVTKDGKTFTGTYTVDKPVLTITAIPQDYVYNGKTQGEGDTVYATAAEIAQKVRVSGLQGGDELTAVTIDGQGTDAGVYELVPSNAAVGPDSAANKRYNIVYVGSTLTISKKPVTVRADDLEKTEGEKDPKLTATVTGLLDGDTLEYTLRREKGEAPGKYAINVTAKGIPNYSVTELPGTLTIRAKQAEPTEEPTAAPTAAPTATPAPEPVPEGHQLEISGTTITRIIYRCSDCGEIFWLDNPSSRNAIPGLVKDDEDEDVDYTAGVTREDGKRILTVTPELEENDPRGIRLRLTPDDLRAWKEEGLDTLRFDRNGTILEIDMAAVPGEWFGEDAAGEKPAYYGFLLRPGDGGTEVKVTAVTADGETPAGRLEGITLKTGEAEIPVTENGTWKAEPDT